MERRDIAIIGTGPGGVSAAITAKIRGKQLWLFGTRHLSEKLEKAKTILNYPGLPAVSGMDLADAMRAQLKSLDIPILETQVTAVYAMGDYFAIQTPTEMYEASAVILAAGVVMGKPFPGEKELLGRGVSYCALCDGFFFRGKTVCVVGGGNSAVSEALYLAKLCRTVYVVHRRDSFTAQEGLLKKLNETPNIQLLQNRTISRILGEEAVRGIVLGTLPAHGEQTLPCDGLFIAIGRTPNTSFLPQALNRDSQGYVYADEYLAANLPGVFAAGDIRKKPLRQIVTAVSDGALAAASVEKYLKNP